MVFHCDHNRISCLTSVATLQKWRSREAGKVGQMVKVFATQARLSEFEPWTPAVVCIYDPGILMRR